MADEEKQRHPIIDPLFDTVDTVLGTAVVVVANVFVAARKGTERFIDSMAKAGQALDKAIDEVGATKPSPVTRCTSMGSDGRHVIAGDDPVCALCNIDTRTGLAAEKSA